MTDGIYNKPYYYHLAFPNVGKWEKKVMAHCFSRHVSFPVKRVLEAACGSGRMLLELAAEGYRVTGYDLSAEMVSFSTERIAEAGLQKMAEVLQGDMASIRFDQEFEAALNLVNSIGYLTNDSEILDHLRNTADSLKPGGIYIVYLGCASEKCGSQSWEIEAEGVSGTVTWGEKSNDRENKLSCQYFEMDALDDGRRITFRDDHTLRLWSYDDFKSLIQQSGRLALEAIYDDYGEPVPIETDITGTHGNLYYVLKVL